MKKLIIFLLFIANYSFGQSVTLDPANVGINPIAKIQKDGTGFDHRNLNGLVGVGTFISNNAGYVQTHTNHPLAFATNNSSVQMVLTTAGNLGIGLGAPTQKLHVQGNGYFTGNLDSDGLVSAGTLSIGGGSTISKIFKVLLSSQQITGVVNNTCSNQYYTVTGVDYGDTVILNMDSVFSTLVVSNVRVTGLN